MIQVAAVTAAVEAATASRLAHAGRAAWDRLRALGGAEPPVEDTAVPAVPAEVVMVDIVGAEVMAAVIARTAAEGPEVEAPVVAVTAVAVEALVVADTAAAEVIAVEDIPAVDTLVEDLREGTGIPPIAELL